MIKKLKEILSMGDISVPNTLVGLFLVGVFLSAPFNTRKLLHYVTTGFDEYTSMFFYGSDIATVLFLLAAFAVFGWRMIFEDIKWPLVVFLAVSFLSVFWSYNFVLSLYTFFRLAVLSLLCVSIGFFIRKNKRMFDVVLATVAASAVFQALVGIAQFLKQDSVGLRLLGESQIGPGASGVARVATAYGRLVRAYGTLPHANIYAAFLVVGLLALLYLWVHRRGIFSLNAVRHISVSVVLGVSIFVVLMGLVVSFSRSGWISALIASVVFLAGLMFTRYRRESLRIGIILLFCGIVLFQLFHFAIVPRIEMTTTKDYAISARLTYNQMGLKLIKEKPFGVGLGTQVLYSVDNKIYHDAGMKRRWEWQPVHNIYILIATEIGVAGLVAFLLFVASIFYRPKSKRKESRLIGCITRFKKYAPTFIHKSKKGSVLSVQLAVSFSIVIGLLVAGLSDHFLWDLQPGRLLLWLAFGIAFGAKRGN